MERHPLPPTDFAVWVFDFVQFYRENRDDYYKNACNSVLYVLYC